MPITQLQFVRNEILKNGCISRNFCLKNFITRCGSRIWDLEQEGFKFKASYKNGDYIYKLIDKEDNKDIKGEKSRTSPVEPLKGQKLTDSLNNKLRVIIQAIPPTWDNGKEIFKIKEIINGKNLYLKESIIQQYDKENK